MLHLSLAPMSEASIPEAVMPNGLSKRSVTLLPRLSTPRLIVQIVKPNERQPGTLAMPPASRGRNGNQ